MAPYYIDIVSPDGMTKREELVERLVIGSGPSAAIRCAGLDPEHVLVIPRGRKGCWVAIASTARTPILVNDQPWLSGILPWGQAFRVGPFEFCPSRPVRQTKSSRVWFPYAGLLLAVVGLLWIFLDGDQAAGGIENKISAPALFDAVPGCPKDVEPLTHANFARRAAAARSERYPFDSSDGVKAVFLYREAAACYDTAGLKDAAQASRSESDSLEKQINGDYAALQLDLELALDKADQERGLGAARALMPLVLHVPDTTYAARLRQIERLLQMKLKEKKNGS